MLHLPPFKRNFPPFIVEKKICIRDTLLVTIRGRFFSLSRSQLGHVKHMIHQLQLPSIERTKVLTLGDKFSLLSINTTLKGPFVKSGLCPLWLVNIPSVLMQSFFLWDYLKELYLNALFEFLSCLWTFNMDNLLKGS